MEEHQETCLETRLRQSTGEEDLTGVRNLIFLVDTNVTQVDHLGTLMPLLEELRLERGSTLASFRDLGSSLSHLRVLWLSACGIFHLDGVGALSALEELYLAFNDVEDLTSIALHDRLQVLDLESNNVDDSEQAIQLGTCSRLWSLNLTANPVCREKRYRRNIVEAVPQLASLDERDVTDDDRRPLSARSDEKDGQNQDDSCQSSSGVRKTSSPSHVAIPSDEIFPTGKALQDFTASRPIGPAEIVGLQDLSGPCSGLKLRGAHPSMQEASQFKDVALSRDIDMQAATTSRQVVDRKLPGCRGHRSQLAGDTYKAYRTKLLAARAVPTEGLRDPPLIHSPRLIAVGRHCEVETEGRGSGGIRTSFGAQIEGDSQEHLSGYGERLNSKLTRGRSDNPETSSDIVAAHFVDEEEMITKAIKNFRLLLESSTPRDSVTGNKRVGDRRSPRRTAAEGGNPLGSNIGGTITSKRGTYQGTGNTSPSRSNSTGVTLDGMQPWSPCGNDDDMDDFATQEGDQRIDQTDGREKQGQTEHSIMGARDVWAGKDWLLKILSLPDMRSPVMSDNSHVSLQAPENAASMLTHGSEVSFAGNPVLGLRHRRRADGNFDGLSCTAFAVRQAKNDDDRRRPEMPQKRVWTTPQDTNMSNASTPLGAGYEIETGFRPQEGSGKGDREIYNKEEMVEARGGVDARRRNGSANLMGGENRTSLHSASATKLRTSRSRRAVVSVKDDMEISTTRRRRRRLGGDPVELCDVTPDGCWQAASSTKAVRKPVEVPEWSPTTATDPDGDSGNGNDGRDIDSDNECRLFFFGKIGQTRDPAGRNKSIQGRVQSGSSIGERVGSGQSTRVVGQGSDNVGVCDKDDEDDGGATEAPWLVDAGEWSNTLARLERVTCRDEQLQGAEQTRADLHFGKGRSVSGNCPTTRGCRRERTTTALKKDAFRRKKHSKTKSLNRIAALTDLEVGESGVDKGKEIGRPALEGQG